jgi:hypothetical protein
MQKERTPKQCRERWANFLNPTIKKSAFTEEEEATVFSAWQDMGPQWVKISELVPGRGDNAIKNCFNAAVRRFCRRISKVLKFSNLLSAFGLEPRETLDSKFIKSLIAQDCRIYPALVTIQKAKFPGDFNNCSALQAVHQGSESSIEDRLQILILEL